ncbi:MAG: hypothetical protein M3P22_02570 [bacterium]|nr:hypothetical protein [bacterium]
MEKSRKMWLWIFVGMGVIPELLWSPIYNFLYSFFKPTTNGSIQVFRDNFLINTDNIYLYLFILFIQIIGLTGILFNILKLNINKYFNYFLFFISLSILIITSLVFYFLFYTRHGIGF